MKDDKQFLEELNQNLGITYKICNAYFSDLDDREDAFQEMMFNLYKGYSSFQAKSKFSTWMYRVCLNTALNYVRNESKKKTWQPLNESHELVAETQYDDENTALVYSAINQLSSVNKAIILLYLDDLSYDDIAEIIGMTKTNVSVRLTRIRKELEVIIQKHNKLNEHA